MRKLAQYKSSPKLLAELDAVTAQASAMRKAPEMQIANEEMSLKFKLESHDYRIFKIEGK
jgi:hypothetical protein